MPLASGTRLADATKVSTLEGLAAIKGLEVLLLDNLPRVTALDPLGSAVSLQELGLKALVSRTTSQLVDSLCPLRSLTRLRRLEMRGVVARDRSLRPLWYLRQLRAVELSNHYSVEEVGKLTGALPGAKVGRSSPTMNPPSEPSARNAGSHSESKQSAEEGVISCAWTATGIRSPSTSRSSALARGRKAGGHGRRTPQ